MHEQIYDNLRSRPEEEAIEIFKRIREGVDAESILRHLEGGDLLLQLALVPETRYRYEFPLIKEMPRHLQRPSNPYLKSLVFEWSSRGLSTSENSAPSTPVSNADEQSPYLKPYHAAKLLDPLLSNVTASRWTAVISNDQLLRQLLSSYFLHHHTLIGIFHKDYFLEDMAVGQDRFCSSLLVNAVLAAACVRS